MRALGQDVSAGEGAVESVSGLEEEREAGDKMCERRSIATSWPRRRGV